MLRSVPNTLLDEPLGSIDKALDDFEYGPCLTTESALDELACGDISQIDHELSLHEDESLEACVFLGRPANPHAFDLRSELAWGNWRWARVCG